MMAQSQETGRTLRLAPIDHPFSREGSHPITLLYYFEERQDFRKLRASLGATLERFFPLKGRLAQTADNELLVVESRESSLGAASFRERQVDEMPDLDDIAAMLRFVAVVDTRIGEPLARFELIHLPRGSLLGISVSHALTDGHGYFFFLMSWAAAARGVDLPDPSHDRGVLHLEGAAAECVTVDEILRGMRAVVLPASRFDARCERIRYEQLFVPETVVKAEAARACEELDVRLSKNDLLTAWLWQRYTAQWNAPGERVSVSCAVDVRRLLEELTPLYFGNASIAATCALPYEQVLNSSIGALGKCVQSCVEALDREGVEGTLRQMDDLRRRGWYRSGSKFGSRAWHPDTGLLVTNVTRMTLARVDFGDGVAQRFYPVGGARVAVVMAAQQGFRLLVGHPIH